MSYKPRQPKYEKIYADSDVDGGVAAEVWSAVVEDLTERDLITPLRARIADRYARDYAEYEMVAEIVRREGAVKAGPNGGDLFSLNWSVAAKLQERLARHEKALMITPEAAGEKSELPKRGASASKASAYLDA